MQFSPIDSDRFSPDSEVAHYAYRRSERLKSRIKVKPRPKERPLSNILQKGERNLDRKRPHIPPRPDSPGWRWRTRLQLLLRRRHTSRQCTRRSARFEAALAVAVICCIQVCSTRAWVAEFKFRADEWVTECEAASHAPAADCSITVPFWQGRGGPRGSFALVVMLQTGNIAIVGEPFPHRAVLRVDKNPPIECRQARYCVFPSMQALTVLKQLKLGSLILIDVYTDKGEFSFSLTPKGFQAGIAQIRAWGYRTD